MYECMGVFIMIVNRDSHIPLYQQIANDLQRKIGDETYEPGQRLPSELELTEVYQVSRLTVRKAIKLLAEDNLIVIQQGKGMFVKFPTIQTDIMNDVLDVDNFRGFYETLVGQGINLKIKLIKFGEEKPPEQIAEALRCSPETKVSAIYRLFYMKDMPMAFNISYLSPNLAFSEKLISELDTRPLSKLIVESNQNDQLSVEEIGCSIEVTPASEEVAKVLEIRQNYPIMSLNRTFYDKNSSPLVAGIMYLNTDTYQFTIRNSKGENNKQNLEMVSIF